MTIVLDASQERAVDLMLSARIGVVTGGAGCGKTTITRFALDRLDEAAGDDMDFDAPAFDWAPYVLASPTGKAAKRLSEAVSRGRKDLLSEASREATTIHRLLEWHPRDGFRRNEARPITARLILIDEASMVDVELGAALLAAVCPRRSRIVFVGDANQLPSVGPGKFFADLIASQRVPTVRLQTVHRAAANTWMVAEAPKVIDGRAPSLETSASFEFVELQEVDEVAEHVEALAKAAKAAGVEAQVLSPQKNTAIGVDALNVRLQRVLNPNARGGTWKTRAGELRPGDRVLQTSNDYDREVFNGETGVVIGTEPIQVRGKTVPMLQVDFGGGHVVSYDREGSKALRLAYAMSIHKSQGSQWDAVIVVCHSAHTHMLSRQLLYTAVTRAKRRVVLIGNRKGLQAAIKDASPAKRNTELAELLREGMEQVA